ncbi:hypothetical protein F3K20_06645 [Streptomyces scabiei]|nr:hypothetical protein [Streptomyces sp. LBUM 1484]MBP5874292.1 hypothetical protein [Streptomyces sp. LBUM 1477]MBP5882028.1 hypothetical protein [Streptomyces sp. LBUM 1487]MBP5895091.1 hypothetical protein [Streptomyces sp. LBUM 1481]MBP5897806.1 hypothetical protein [Streptomyces sp. LBUM 1488]MBP5925367.1 hypothetical protein [Streptomyces sp. LBUM 1483]QTU44558.1 hypothetical protein F3K20_06645 [Streptomyces sp. LBUM 1482]
MSMARRRRINRVGGPGDRPSHPIDAPSEEQLRLNFREASFAVIYSEDPGDDRRPLPVGEEHHDADSLR